MPLSRKKSLTLLVTVFELQQFWFKILIKALESEKIKPRPSFLVLNNETLLVKADRLPLHTIPPQ